MPAGRYDGKKVSLAQLEAPCDLRR